MKQFLIIGIFAAVSFTGLNAQSNSEIQNKKQLEVVQDNIVELVTFEVKTLKVDVAAKKKDILNAKINSKLKGIVDLFFVADKSIVC
jgi:hypothetical protein